MLPCCPTAPGAVLPCCPAVSLSNVWPSQMTPRGRRLGSNLHESTRRREGKSRLNAFPRDEGRSSTDVPKPPPPPPKVVNFVIFGQPWLAAIRASRCKERAAIPDSQNAHLVSAATLSQKAIFRRKGSVLGLAQRGKRWWHATSSINHPRGPSLLLWTLMAREKDVVRRQMCFAL